MRDLDGEVKKFKKSRTGIVSKYLRILHDISKYVIQKINHKAVNKNPNKTNFATETNSK